MLDENESKFTCSLQSIGFDNIHELIKSTIDNISKRFGSSLSSISRSIMNAHPSLSNVEELDQQLKLALKVGVKSGWFFKNGSLYSNNDIVDKDRMRTKSKRSQVDDSSVVIALTKSDKDTRTNKVRGNTANNLNTTPSDHFAGIGELTNKLIDIDTKDMFENGWQLSPLVSPYMGLRLRYYLGPFSYSDGTVNAVLVASMNHGLALYHILLDSGVRVCVHLEDLIVCRELLLSNRTDLTAGEFSEMFSALYRDMYTSTEDVNNSVSTSSANDSSSLEVECIWQSRVAGGGSFLLRRYSTARQVSLSLGVPLTMVMRCCRTGAWHARNSTESVQFNRRVMFRFKKTASGSSGSNTASPLPRMVSEDVVRVLLTTTFPIVAGSLATPSHSVPSLGSNVRVVCLALDATTVLREFDDVWQAARELHVPLAGLRMALSARGTTADSQVASFAGLWWRHSVGHAKSESQVPVDVLRAMVLVQQTEWAVEKVVSDTHALAVVSVSSSSSSSSFASVEGDLQIGHEKEREEEVTNQVVMTTEPDAGETDQVCEIEPNVQVASVSVSLISEQPDAHVAMDLEKNSVIANAVPSPTFAEISCMSLDGVQLFKFPSLQEACVAMKFRSDLFVRLCCKGALQQYGGFRWSLCFEGSEQPSSAPVKVLVETNTMESEILTSEEVQTDKSELTSAVCVDAETVSADPSESENKSERGDEKGTSMSGEKKVPITATELQLLSNVFMHDYNPQLVLMVSETEDTSNDGDEEEDEDEEEDDKRPTEEENNRRLQTMRDEGWLFAPTDNEYIGLRVRRFFPDNVVSDARVDAFLPAALNEGEPQWHLKHDDGDEEDVEFLPMLQYIKSLQQNLQSEHSQKPQPTVAPSAPSTASSRWGGSTSAPLTGGTEVHDRNTEKLRVIATERRVVDDETIEEVLQQQYREDCAVSGGQVVPPVSGLCSLVITIIKGFGETGAHTNNLVAHISKHIRPPRTATFERSLRHLLNQLVRINILHKEDNNLPMNERKFVIANKYLNASNVLDITGTLERDSFSLETAPIDCLAINNEFLMRFADLYEASKMLGIGVAQIKKICFGQRKTTKNLRFQVAAPTADLSPLSAAARQTQLDRVLAIMSRGAGDGGDEEEEDSDEDSSGSGYYVGARKRLLGVPKKKAMIKDDYPPTKPTISRDCQVDVPDIIVLEASSSVVARRPKLSAANRTTSPDVNVSVESDGESPYWNEKELARVSESKKTSRFHKFEERRLQALQDAEEEASFSSGGDPLSRCVTLPHLVVGDYLYRRRRDPSKYEEQYRSYLQQARRRQIRQGSILAVALSDKGDGARRLQYVCVVKDLCGSDVTQPSAKGCNSSSFDKKSISSEETGPLISTNSNVPASTDIVIDKEVVVTSPEEPPVNTVEQDSETSPIRPDDLAKQSPADTSPSPSNDVDVFDGRTLRRVSLDDLLLQQEDVLLASLVEAGGDVVRALCAVEKDARDRLMTQWNAKEVSQYMEGVKVYKTDAPLIFHKTALKEGPRSVKDVIEFHYKFYFLNSTQIQNRELALGRVELLNVFRCADLLLEADTKYVDKELLRLDMERLGFFAALDAFSVEIEETLSRKINSSAEIVTAAAHQTTKLVSVPVQGKKGKQALASSSSNGNLTSLPANGSKKGPALSAKLAGCENGVVMVNISTGQNMRIYPSVKYVAQAFRCQSSDVMSCVQGRIDQCQGFRWRAYDGPRINFAQFPHGLEIAQQQEEDEERQGGAKRKLGEGDESVPSTDTTTKRPYPQVILEAICKSPVKFEGANLTAIIDLIAKNCPGVHYKPTHIQNSVEKMLGTGVLERFMTDRVRITPTGQTVLSKLREIKNAPRLSVEQVDELVRVNNVVSLLTTFLKNYGSQKSYTVRNFRSIMQRTPNLSDSLKVLDSVQLQDVIRSALMRAEQQGLVMQGQTAGEFVLAAVNQQVGVISEVVAGDLACSTESYETEINSHRAESIAPEGFVSAEGTPSKRPKINSVDSPQKDSNDVLFSNSNAACSPGGREITREVSFCSLSNIDVGQQRCGGVLSFSESLNFPTPTPVIDLSLDTTDTAADSTQSVGVMAREVVEVASNAIISREREVISLLTNSSQGSSVDVEKEEIGMQVVE